MQETAPRSKSLPGIDELYERLSDSVFEYVRNRLRPRGVYVVGSLANNEAAIIVSHEQGSQLIVSDFDLIVVVDAVTFVKNLVFRLEKRVSEALSSFGTSKGLTTRVSLIITSLNLARYLPSLGPNSIYLYEMREVRFTEAGRELSAKRMEVTPNKLDCLNLAFSCVAEYLFSRLNSIGIEGKIYILAKRLLLLSYSLLLCVGDRPRGYQSIPCKAREHLGPLRGLMTDNDLDVLQVLADYRLKGDCRILIERLPIATRDMPGVLTFLCGRFEEVAKRALSYELGIYFDADRSGVLDHTWKVLTEELETYRSQSSRLSVQSLVHGLSYLLFYLVSRDFNRFRVAVRTLLLARLEIHDWLRYSVGHLFRIHAGCGRDRENSLSHIVRLKVLWDQFMM